MYQFYMPKTTSMDIIKRPTLLVNRSICHTNIQRMEEHARMNRVAFRPHFKTHQSAEIGSWFQAMGIRSITVSSVSMASFFAEQGWQDITIAFPLNHREWDDITRLSETNNIQVLLESTRSAEWISKQECNNLGFFIEIDTGHKRTGIHPGDISAIEDILETTGRNPNLHFRGFLTHTGQTYRSEHTVEMMQHHVEAGKALVSLKEQYENKYPGMIISTGDTPSCSLFDPFPGMDEIRPGNFVFYDLMQYYLGSCKISDIAVALASPVVSIHPERSEVVIYGGAVHLSKDSVISPEGISTYGLAVKLGCDGWDTDAVYGHVISLSQEHGIIQMEAAKQLLPGDLLAILPVHSCLTMDLMQYRPEGVRII